jgi:hypothetical protein
MGEIITDKYAEALRKDHRDQNFSAFLYANLMVNLANYNITKFT